MRNSSHLSALIAAMFLAAISIGWINSADAQSVDGDRAPSQILLGDQRVKAKEAGETAQDDIPPIPPAPPVLRDAVNDDDASPQPGDSADNSEQDSDGPADATAATEDDRTPTPDSQEDVAETENEAPDTDTTATREEEADAPADVADTPTPEASDREEDDEKVADTRPQKKNELLIASWGGAYEKSQTLAYFDPFSKETGIKIETQSHSGDLGRLKRDEGDGAADWDVVDLSFEQAEKACNKGLLELINPKDLAPSGEGAPAKDDFFQDALHPCGVASMAWSSLIVYDKRAFGKKAPTSLVDFFNVKKFPGKRALRKGAKYNLALALMADGVETDKIYATLQTDEGLERALKKLETLRKHIVWWEKPEEPLTLLKTKKVSMATSYNGRSFFVIAGQSQPFGLIWDGQIYAMDMWAIPRSSRNKDDALKFISYATKPDRLAAQTQWFPYGPMRKSAVPLIGQHAEVGIDMAPFIPTAAENFKNALPHDAVWWSRQEERLEKQFATWLANPPKVVKKPKRKKKLRKYKKRKYKKRRKKKN